MTQEAVRQTRAGEEERKSDKEEREEREFPWRLNGYISTADLILYV